MKLKGLSFENIPPLHVPLRFFQTAPVFGIFAALLLLLYPEALQSRWQPPLLAFTHLLTLGFGACVMLGALFQVMPVVTGQTLPKDGLIAPLVRWGVVAGALLLATAFIAGTPALFALATLSLVFSLLVFVTALGLALGKVSPVGDSAFCLRFAALALAITAALGVAQASHHFWPALNLYHPAQTDLHAAWGGFGWSLGLVMAVAIQVIPMFHVTPAFPRWISRLLAPSLFLLLAFSTLYGLPGIQAMALAAVALCGFVFAICALRVLGKRKRKLLDWTVRFWRLGLAHLAVVAAAIPGYLLAAPATLANEAALMIGLGFGLGFVATVMIGMLQKIVPFLIYLHLQRACLSRPAAMIQLPNMKAIITTGSSRMQFHLHAAALALIYAAVLLPSLTPVAALALLLDFGWLTRTLFTAAGVYAKSLETIKATAT